MEEVKPDYTVEIAHRCGHTCSHDMWGHENLEQRKTDLTNLPCSPCIELNRIASGCVDGLYSRKPMGERAAWFDKWYPGWRNCIETVKLEKPSFGVEKSKRDAWLDRLVASE